MLTDLVPLIAGVIIFLSSLISLRLGISVAVIEILAGIVAGNCGLKSQEWMIYLANFGGIILTFLAGTEIDTQDMKKNWPKSLAIGGFSFLVPFVVISLLSFYLLHWTLKASLIAGIALSTTSLAVVYSVLVESGLSRTKLGKLLMSSTFITDMGTALALSVLFIKPDRYTLLFYGVSIAVIVLAAAFSHKIFGHHRLKNKVIEAEIKYIFVLLLILIFFAKLGGGHAVLPAFLLGLFMSKYFSENSEHRAVMRRLRTVAYAVITPLFFIVGGLRVSIPMIVSVAGLFGLFLGAKLLTKFLGVYFWARKFIPGGGAYTTLLMSTGLTLGRFRACSASRPASSLRSSIPSSWAW